MSMHSQPRAEDDISMESSSFTIPSASVSTLAPTDSAVGQTTVPKPSTSANLSTITATEIESQVRALQSDPQCYCGKSRDLRKPELLCSICYKWFHATCITYYIGSCVPFMTNYHFTCKHCSPNAQEAFTKKQAGFSQMCITALANLYVQHPGHSVFSRDKEIIPFLEAHWDALTTQPKKSKQSWHQTIMKAIGREENFVIDESTPNESLIGLRRLELAKIAPNYEQFKQLTSQLKTVGGVAAASAAGAAGGIGGGIGLGAASAQAQSSAPWSALSRGTKRKLPPAGGPTLELTGTRSKKVEERIKLTVHGYPVEHPFNKGGFHFLFAENDINAPGRISMRDDPTEWLGKPMPAHTYRLYLSPLCLLSMNDRAGQLHLADDRLTVLGEKGYSMVRATHGVRSGAWYWEVEIKSMPDLSACRLGWAQPSANLQTPCGFDKFSYSFRSRKGTAFHGSRGHHYSDRGYGQGDVIGCLIYLPLPLPPNVRPDSSQAARILAQQLPPSYKDRHLAKFKNLLYFQEKDNVLENEKSLKPLPGSKILYFVNGECVGVAFEKVYEGRYYPAISLYRNTQVQARFGILANPPALQLPSQNGSSSSNSGSGSHSQSQSSNLALQSQAPLQYLAAAQAALDRILDVKPSVSSSRTVFQKVRVRPMCEAAPDAEVEQTLSDILFLAERSVDSND